MCIFQINLDKKEERWWESLVTSEPKISVRKIDASRPMTDLDQEAQSKIAEMMYNDRQKKLGLPQSHEQVSGEDHAFMEYTCGEDHAFMEYTCDEEYMIQCALSQHYIQRGTFKTGKTVISTT
jgi:hypothetical protein